MLASRSRLARTEAAVHRYARSSSLATSPRSTNHSIHTSCPPRRRTGFSPHCPASLGQTKGAAVTGRPQNQGGGESAAAERPGSRGIPRDRAELDQGDKRGPDCDRMLTGHTLSRIPLSLIVKNPG